MSLSPLPSPLSAAIECPPPLPALRLAASEPRRVATLPPRRPRALPHQPPCAAAPAHTSMNAGELYLDGSAAGRGKRWRSLTGARRGAKRKTAAHVTGGGVDGEGQCGGETSTGKFGSLPA